MRLSKLIVMIFFPLDDVLQMWLHSIVFPSNIMNYYILKTVRIFRLMAIQNRKRRKGIDADYHINVSEK